MFDFLFIKIYINISLKKLLMNFFKMFILLFKMGVICLLKDMLIVKR